MWPTWVYVAQFIVVGAVGLVIAVYTYRCWRKVDNDYAVFLALARSLLLVAAVAVYDLGQVAWAVALVIIFALSLIESRNQHTSLNGGGGGDERSTP